MGLKKIRLSSVHLYGGVYRVSRNTNYWTMAKRIAKEISVSQQHLMVHQFNLSVYIFRLLSVFEEKNEELSTCTYATVLSSQDSPARYVRLLKAYFSSVRGLIFEITIRVKGVDGTSVAYTAQVWYDICNRPIQVLAFHKVPGSERKPKDWEIVGSNDSDKKISTKKMGKKGLDLFKGLSSSVAMTSSELDCRNDTGRLRARGFYILLEQIRSQRSWNYSRARKCASTIWQGLPESEKMLFLSEAASRMDMK